MDHPGARIGRFTPSSMAPIIKQFGFYAMRNGGRTDMFTHGLALTSSIQKQEELSNSAVYFMMERAPDDPWDALKRLLRRRSAKPFQDLRSLAPLGWWREDIASAVFIARRPGQILTSHGSKET